MLRIFSILIIILNHYSLYGGFYESFTFDNIRLNQILLQWFHIGGKKGVDIFVFISGYFLCQTKHFKVEKVVRLVLETCFYAIIVVILGTKYCSMNTDQALFVLFSIPSGLWPFISFYLLMYISSPFINKMIENISLSQHFLLSSIFTFCWVLIPSFTPYAFHSEYDLGWFIYIYLMASLIYRLEKVYNLQSKKYLIVGVCCIVLIALSEVILDFNEPLRLYFNNNAEHFRELNSILVMLCTISLFLGFKSLKPFSSKLVNMYASTSLGILLLHDNWFMQVYGWKNIFHTTDFIDRSSILLVMHATLCVILIFVIMSNFDLIRQKFIEKPNNENN